jgi:hypothetical protein
MCFDLRARFPAFFSALFPEETPAAALFALTNLPFSCDNMR